MSASQVRPEAKHAFRRHGAAITTVFALAVFGSLVAPACSAETNVDATCTPNVTKDGIRVVDNGCDEFAVCRDAAGKQQDPMKCCTPTPKDSDLASCLYGYGVGAPVGGSGGSNGGSTSTSKGGGTNSGGGL